MDVYKPFVSNALAISLAADIFNLVVDVSSSAVKEFPSYDDRNFYLRGTRDGVEGEFVLKVLNSNDSANKGLVEEINALMILLNENGIPCPVPQPTVSGKLFEMRQLYTDTEDIHAAKRSKKEPSYFAVRLFNFMPGKTMRDVPSSGDLFYKVGCITGEVDKILKDFKCPVIQDRYYCWDMRNLHEAIELSSNIKDPHKKEILKNIEKSFKIFVEPKFNVLPKQCIHGDVNEGNLIVRGVPGSTTNFEISGLIDFGDLLHTCRVFEVSTAAAYMATMASEDVVEAAAYTVAGYQQNNPLTEMENDLIYYLIQTRLYQSICFGINSSKMHPENSEYLLYTEKRAWEVLDKFAAILPEEFEERWHKLGEPSQNLNVI